METIYEKDNSLADGQQVVTQRGEMAVRVKLTKRFIEMV